MSVVRYGGIFVSAGVTIMGLLWYNGGRGVSGESVAEIVAGENERSVASEVRAHGADDFAFASRTVTSAVVWTPLERVLASVKDSVLPFDEVDALEAYWLDDWYTFPADNADVVQYAYTWTSSSSTDGAGLTTVEWNLSYGGGYPHLLTADTRYSSASTLYVRLFDAAVGVHTHVPGVSLFRDTGVLTGYESHYWGGVGNWWSYKGLGTNLYLWQHVERLQGTNATPYVSHAIQTNSLSDLRTVMSSMTRSMVVVPWSTADEYFGVTNTVRTDIDGYSAIDVTNSTAAQAISAMKAAAVAGQTQTSVTGAVFNGVDDVLASADISGNNHAGTITYDPDPPPPTNFNYSGASCRFHKSLYTNLVASYPCRAAFATGLVARVRVYAMASGAVGVPLEPTYNTNQTTVTSTTADTTTPPSYDNLNLSTGLKLGAHPSLSSMTITPNRINDFRGVPSEPFLWYWTLVSDTGANPTAPMPFTLGNDFSVAGIANKQFASIRTFTDTAGTDTDETRTYYLFDQRVQIDFLVIVVDWNFKHLGATEYVPEHNTPAWAVTNAP